MNIAVFQKRTTFHKNSGGLETQSKELFEEITKRGHKVFIISPKWELDADFITENSISYHFLDAEYRMGKFFGFGGSCDLKNWKNVSSNFFDEFCKKNEIDLLVSQSSAGVSVLKKRKKYNIKGVVISHGTIINEFKTSLLEYSFPNDLIKYVKDLGFVLKNYFGRQRDMVFSADKIIAVSNFVKRSLVEETFVQEDHIVVIPNGISLNTFDTEKSFEDKLKIISIGRIEKSKGFQVLINALYNASFDFELEIIGDGPYLNTLKSLTTSQNIKFLGRLSRDEIFSKLKSAHLFVFPTLRFEGFPMVLVEAMFCNICIVASDIGGVSDAINNSNGFLVSPNDPKQLLDIISKLNSDRNLIKSKAGIALKDAFSRYTISEVASKYLEIFESLKNENYKNNL